MTGPGVSALGHRDAIRTFSGEHEEDVLAHKPILGKQASAAGKQAGAERWEMRMAGSGREPLTPELGVLGEILRLARVSAGATMRDVEEYSSGHISNVENRRVMPSRELVVLYVARFGCDRMRALSAYERAKSAASARRSGRSGGASSFVDEEVGPESDIDAIRRTYRVRDVETSYTLGAEGQVVEAVTIRSLTAVAPRVGLAVARFNYPTDPRPGVLDITAIAGCSILRRSESHTGAISAVLALEREVQRNEGPHTYAFRVSVRSQVPALPKIRYYASGRTQRCALRVKFHNGRPPAAVWWFRSASRAEVEYGDEVETNLLSGDDGHFYFADFYDLDTEHCGIAWRWA
ncbi:helix-turn-helix domain-containing protein [Nocardiopsis composta]